MRKHLDLDTFSISHWFLTDDIFYAIGLTVFRQNSPNRLFGNPCGHAKNCNELHELSRKGQKICTGQRLLKIVIPAQAGIHHSGKQWIPASAGMTFRGNVLQLTSDHYKKGKKFVIIRVNSLLNNIENHHSLKSC